MGFGDRETCGRCSMTTVVDATEDGEGAADRDPFGDDRIELDDAELRRTSPTAWLSGVVSALDDIGNRLTYGRR
ncbi:hypothetical protein K6T50_10170 [Halobaculum magnesiiphilum]|uniref:Uncharacterized protein n=2 Tax=Halobaculum magnesiiphilum TaxID=1017351 RepID=A0A8T8WGX8_9EURY|nr:hypothetical protein [Halobaculum magnesiiphilum]QZP39090.1 hypothetical protein K6T50_10170 [Halobaculum magnesiiphilum]